MWDGEIEAVKPYNLSEYPYSPAQKAQVAAIRDRLLRLRDAIVKAPKLKTTALAVVADIGKKQEPQLSAIEEKLLGTLEREFLDGQS